jgi:hypothetical protein
MGLLLEVSSRICRCKYDKEAITAARFEKTPMVLTASWASSYIVAREPATARSIPCDWFLIMCEGSRMKCIKSSLPCARSLERPREGSREYGNFDGATLKTENHSVQNYHWQFPTSPIVCDGVEDARHNSPSKPSVTPTM